MNVLRQHLKIYDGMYGLCVGNALGVPAKKIPRDALDQHPVTSMIGGGPLGQVPGTWSYDTSFALCLLSSLGSPLVEINFNDVVERFWQCCRGRRCCAFDQLFDCDEAIRTAVYKKPSGGNPLLYGLADEKGTSCGSMARSLPIVWHLQSHFGSDFSNSAEVWKIIHDVASLTHRHPRALIATGIYVSIAFYLLSDMPISIAVPVGIQDAFRFYSRCEKSFRDELTAFSRLEDGSLFTAGESAIRSSTDAVDSLEGAVWSLMNSSSYDECVIRAVNLGVNGDSLGAMAGGLAGLFYGRQAIPESWINAIVNLDEINQACEHSTDQFIKNCVSRLSAFIPFLEGVAVDEVYSCSFDSDPEKCLPVYCERLLEFVTAFNHSCLINYNYRKVTRANRQLLSHDLISRTIAEANFELVTAILTTTIRLERFQPGSWIGAVQRHIFLDCVRRLVQLNA